VFLTETRGDLRLDVVDTDGDVSLVTLDGSIVDARAGGGGAVTAGVLGNSVDLVANRGGIGSPTNDVEIDSSRGTAGDVGLMSDGVVFVTETDGPLNLLLAEGTTIRLTVRESADLDEDLTFVASGSIRKGEGQVRTVGHSSIVASAGSVELRVGDDITTLATSEILAATWIDIYGDDVNLDPGVGTVILLRGEIRPNKFFPHGHVVRVFGHTDADSITFDRTQLGGRTRAFGGQNLDALDGPDGEDTFTVIQLQSMDTGAGHTLTLDGQAQSDTYTIHTTGSRGARRDYVVNVLDTGARGDGTDQVFVHGGDVPAQSETSPTDDIFLLRRATSIPNETSVRPAYVALVHGTLAQHRDLDRLNAPSEVQRVNYDSAIEGRLVVYGQGGNDYFAVDDNSAITTLDGGADADTFQIGQLYGNKRDVAEGRLPASDVFPDLVAVTRGWLSPGASVPLEVSGGDGRDAFTVYGNRAPVRLYGDDGDDTFEVRSFALAVVVDTDANNDGVRNAADVDGPTVDTNGDGVVNAADARTTATWQDDIVILTGGVARPVLGASFTAGKPADVRSAGNENQVRYVANGPVTIDGGAGSADKLVVLGTEFADRIGLTQRQIAGAGLDVRSRTELDVRSRTETVEVDGLEGDDAFAVVGTPSGTTTTVIGGPGTDTIDVNGDMPTDLVVRQLEGTASVADHRVRSGDAGYDRIVVPGVDVTVASPVIIAETGGLSAAREGVAESYSVRLARAPTGTVYVVVSAAAAPLAETGAESVLVSTDQTFYRSVLIGGVPTLVPQRAVVLVFTPATWNVAQTVNVLAVDDTVNEGDRTATISHATLSSDPAFDHAGVRNVEVLVRDNDRTGVHVVEVNGSTEDAATVVLEGDATTAINDDLTVELTRAPTANKVVVVKLVSADAEVQLSSTDPRFNATARTITFTAANWNSPVRITVKAKQDTLVEDPLVSVITIKRDAQTTDPAFTFADQTLAVEVLDDDKPGLVVTPTDRTTVVAPGLNDAYTVRLTKRPSATVTMAVVGDGLTDVRTINGAPAALQVIGELVGTTLFTGSVTFSTSAKTITRTSGSFLTDGFAAGQLLRVVGGPNAGDYTIASVTATRITVTGSFASNGPFSVSLQRLARNGTYTGQVSFDAVNNRLVRTDGGSWLADGFAEGQRIRIDGVGDFKIALIRGTSATKDNVLQLTAERVLPASTPGMRTVNRIAAVVTFTTTNWNVAQTVEVGVDPFYSQPVFRVGLVDHARAPRVASRLRGPVNQVADSTGADRSLKAAAKLPKEADANLRPIGGDPSAALVGSYEVTHSEAEWGNKFEARITITNNSNSPQNWTVTLTFPSQVTGLAAAWVDGQTAPTTSRNGQTFTITGTQPVPPGATIVVWVQFNTLPYVPGAPLISPTDCRVGGLACEMP
jgi:hypothetical protein